MTVCYVSDAWVEIAVYPERLSAEAAAGLLRSESIPVRVLVDEPVPGLVRGCSLQVPETMAMHARKLCSGAALSEEEWAAQYGSTDDAAEEPGT